MIFFMISCFSFILLSKSFSLRTLPAVWNTTGVRWSSLAWFWREVSYFFVMSWFRKSMIAITYFSTMPSEEEVISLKSENVAVEEDGIICLLDLPELALECILELLSPAELCSMARACSGLRERCISDHLWERHMKQKWGRLIKKGDAAYRKWQWHIIASRKRKRSTTSSTLLNGTNQNSALFGAHVSSLWPLSVWNTNTNTNTNNNRSKSGTGSSIDQSMSSNLPVDSIMALYFSLETGNFWFQAQVYNRENGNVGFMLSCYDAELSYDSSTDTFKARYSPHGRRTIEENIEWERVRVPPVDTPAHVLHASDCLDDLEPGDHIEIQWRRNKEFPYGWWYGVVSHLESCNRNRTHCKCHSSDTVILEFKQYTPGSRWRETTINRKDHREVGNEADGFYGGIRKLYHEEEISVWKHLWPTQVLE